MPRRFQRVRKAFTGALAALAGTGNVLDAAIYQVSPAWGVKRQQTRELKRLLDRQSEMLSGWWDGADDGRLRGDRWLKQRLSPDSALELDLDDLRRRSSELYRTFGYCHGAIENRTDIAIGIGMRPQAAIKPLAGFITENQAKLWNEELEAIFERMAPVAGKGGQESLWEVQRQAERNWKRDGEAFIVFSDVGRADKPVPLEVETIAPERVETPPKEAGNPRVRLGVQKDADGVVEGYWIRRSHPDDTKATEIQHDFFPADRVVHIFEKQFPGQTRGLPWFTAILNDIRDFKDFREATIISAQVAACVTMIVNTANPKAAAEAAQNSDGEEDLEPGKILYRHHSDEVSTLNPNQPATSYGMFAEWNLLGMAGGLNWPFGWLTKDRRRASYSAGKLEEIDGDTVVKVDRQKIRDRLLSRYWQRMTTEAVITGAVSIPPDAYNRRPWLYTRHKWIAPGRPWIDPTREVSAAVEAKEHNLTTLAEILNKVLGEDVTDVLRQRQKERELEAELGVEPPIKSGQPRPDDSRDDRGADEVETQEEMAAHAG